MDPEKSEKNISPAKKKSTRRTRLLREMEEQEYNDYQSHIVSQIPEPQLFDLTDNRTTTEFEEPALQEPSFKPTPKDAPKSQGCLNKQAK